MKISNSFATFTKQTVSDSIANSNFWPEVQRCLWSWDFFGFKIDGQCHEATFFHISPGINLELTVLISRNTWKLCTLINQCHAMYMYANGTKCEFVKSQKAKMLGFLSFLWNQYSGIFFEVKWEFWRVPVPALSAGNGNTWLSCQLAWWFSFIAFPWLHVTC